MIDSKPPKQENYHTAVRMGWDDLEKADLPDLALHAGAGWDEKRKSLALTFLGKDFELLTDQRKVVLKDSGEFPKQWQEIILLHYIRDAKGTPPTGKIISYKEIPDARLYWPNFQARVNNILLKGLGPDPRKLFEVAEKAGLKPAPADCAGDVNIKIKALPKVELIIQMWKGDDEFGPEASVVFDSSIVDYLPAEDITVMCQMMALQLMQAAFGS